MNDLLTAMALVLVLEGLCYAIAPEAMKRLALSMQLLSATHLRITGLVVAFVGVALVWLVRQSGFLD